MKISKSKQLVAYLYQKDIPFLMDGENLIIDTSDYINLCKSLKPYQLNRFKIMHSPNVVTVKSKKEKIRNKPKTEYQRTIIENAQKIIPDKPKKIERPPAIYSNPDYKNMYL